MDAKIVTGFASAILSRALALGYAPNSTIFPWRRPAAARPSSINRMTVRTPMSSRRTWPTLPSLAVKRLISE
jgi:hypothetical protein